MKSYISVDLGGTNVRVALVNEQGKIEAMKKGNSHPERGADHVVDTIVELVQDLDGYERAEGVGIVVPGLLDPQRRKIVAANNLPKLVDYPFADRLSEKLSLPVYLSNDVKAAALGEAVAGAGKGKAIVYYISISTGIGGAAVIEGDVLTGSHGFAGEVGNIIIDPNREQYGIMNAGSIESEASGTALMRKGKEMISEEIEHAGHVFEKAQAGDANAKKIVQGLIDDLSTLLSTIALVIDPNVIVLGGGVMKGKEVFLPQLKDAFSKKIFKQMTDTPIVEAELEEPGIIGAAMEAKRNIEKTN